MEPDAQGVLPCLLQILDQAEAITAVHSQDSAVADLHIIGSRAHDRSPGKNTALIGERREQGVIAHGQTDRCGGSRGAHRLDGQRIIRALGPFDGVRQIAGRLGHGLRPAVQHDLIGGSTDNRRPGEPGSDQPQVGGSGKRRLLQRQLRGGRGIVALGNRRNRCGIASVRQCGQIQHGTGHGIGAVADPYRIGSRAGDCIPTERIIAEGKSAHGIQPTIVGESRRGGSIAVRHCGNCKPDAALLHLAG